MTVSMRSSLKLAGGTGGGEGRREVLVAGGGATNAVCLHRARAAGLEGFEFASAIPGRRAAAYG